MICPSGKMGRGTDRSATPIIAAGYGNCPAPLRQVVEEKSLSVSNRIFFVEKYLWRRTYNFNLSPLLSKKPCANGLHFAPQRRKQKIELVAIVVGLVQRNEKIISVSPLKRLQFADYTIIQQIKVRYTNRQDSTHATLPRCRKTIG